MFATAGTMRGDTARRALAAAESSGCPCGSFEEGPSVLSHARARHPRVSAGHLRRTPHRPRFCLGAQLAISVNNCPPPRDPRSRMTSFKRTQRKDVQKAYRVRELAGVRDGSPRSRKSDRLGSDSPMASSPTGTRRSRRAGSQADNASTRTTPSRRRSPWALVCGLASRQTEGFLRSLLTLLNLDNDVPDHRTISRRKARLGKVASSERRTVKPVHLRIDSSGLSVPVGQLRTPPKARDYRKLHLAVDEQTSDVVACELTSKRARDASRWRHSSARSSVPSPRPRPTPRTTPATSRRRWSITVLIDRRRC